MDADSKRQKRRDNALLLLGAAIEAMNLAKEISSPTPAKAVFGSVSILLTMIRDSMANKTDYVDLGIICADVCRALERGTNGKGPDDLNQSVREAIAQLKTTVAEIHEKVVKQSERNVVSRLVHAKNDKDTVASWKLDLNRILHVFNTELAITTHMLVLDLHRNALTGQERADGQHSSTQSKSAISNSMGSTVLLFHSVPPGELPPPPLRACFGRDELIEKIVGLAENLTPLALIGPGGIGKTSVALAVLHNDRIKKRFGDDRRFIRCDQFPASCTHFLSQLSRVVGAGVENPKDLIPLQPFLSSREMILFLDNAESILDPQGPDAQEIYALTEELSRFSNICLCLTSRISTIPPSCESLDVPTLSMEAARDTFHGVYKNGGHSDLVGNILEQLDFHPLSITLLATVAHHNKWDIDRLNREWEGQRTGILHTRHNTSLAATIELSLASPTFQELGPDARELLGVVAFFPQGVNENNLDWLFPTLSNRTGIFDNFCVLSLTYRSNGSIMMLAPLRDYLCPKYPALPPLLHATKDRYFHRLSVDVDPDKPGPEEAQWIVSEDANVEHLLDVFTSIDTNSVGVWTTCAYFMRHLCWHKQRLVMLGPKIEGLPDDHCSKPQCLFELSQLFDSVGNQVECKRLLIHTLKLWRERGDNSQVARTLRFLSDVNRLLGLWEEGVEQAKEALEIYGRLDDILGQAHSLHDLAWLLFSDGQLDAAEEATSRAIRLLSDKDEQFRVCECYRLLGNICHSKGETEKAIDHLKTALAIASPFNWRSQLFWIHYRLAELFFGKNRFDDAYAHVELAKSHAVNGLYFLGRAIRLQAEFWYKQRKLEKAKSEALRAVEVFEKLGATWDVEYCRSILRKIEKKMERPGYLRWIPKLGGQDTIP